MLKKMVDVDELICALRRAGMDAGLCAEGSSSYPLVRLAGDLEIYGFIPDPTHQGPEESELIAQNLLDKLANQEETAPVANQPAHDMTVPEAEAHNK
jgi:hypothetical protein